ncbi:gas vesicle protein GvpO [Halocatena pleomorpha]|uniref:Gas vesicle protein n=1 Tax=Halocatena pleomorpha TaxID=1785090 RepID=A0A3P3R9C0_9EURY|nr:gas vesicle protein [Halocatena pleomorpha]RRJ29539.1 gas vesicle protein [Halocatena pleomorpha]
MTAIDPSEHTIDELENEIGTIDDPDELQSILNAEENDKDRKGAKALIESRLSEVKDGEGERAPETDSGINESALADGEADLIDIRNRVREITADLIGRDFDGVSAIRREEDNWVIVVNLIERHSVPDTQDIMGRYEVHLDSDGDITGYHQLNRYRRSYTDYEGWC